MASLYEIGPSGQEVQLTDLLLKLQVVRIHVVEFLEGLDHLCLQRGGFTHLEIVGYEHYRQRQRKDCGDYGYVAV